MKPHSLDRYLLAHFGGGGGNTIAQQPVPANAPPVTSTDAEVVQAQQDVLRQQLMKKGIKSTVHAGDFGSIGGGAGPGPGMMAPQPTTWK
jgi:hypothetical protein